ncbi:MAG: hypothetical protein COA52_01200 [Hyphomicrobiales bacterium]|nr:MAG: hypothetical protein COA52_00110 [Hyphomicrobiales bacterium]PCJ96853.1 MAG: hypothetical protein COA52_01200 [Hyphomicrobiales bacterium]
MEQNCFILALEIDDGKYQPLAWTKDKLSNKQLRSVLKKFKKDKDVIRVLSMCWNCLYRNIKEAKSELSQY